MRKNLQREVPKSQNRNRPRDSNLSPLPRSKRVRKPKLRRNKKPPKELKRQARKKRNRNPKTWISGT
jgi:hypothetical protein